MDWLRRVWSAVYSSAPVDPRHDLLQTDVVDQPVWSTGLITVLRSIVLADLVPTILAYFVDVDYRWPMPTDLPPSVAVSGNKAVVSADLRRFVAWPSITDGGSHRWRIQTEFTSATEDGAVLVGISKSPAGCFRLISDAATADEYLVSANVWPPKGRVSIFHGGKTSKTAFSRLPTRRTMTLVEVDLPNRTMNVTFRDARSIIRVVSVALPRSSAIVWRPCVTLIGSVSATILMYYKKN